ncbi:SRPBCC family protein [Tabrizicola sp. BL-A-41-H6]|uniref:SRPBCC family protein n=1 Tax=Tabrizicola sp. BL-A-41-H6 TaxID=3421107 RepID=UPI003D6749C7
MTVSLTLTRQLNAQPARVFAALTQPDQMLRWWVPDAGTTLHASADLRPGGRYAIGFRLADGSEHHPTGLYREVIPDARLSFTWEWPGRPEATSLVTIRLTPRDGGTHLTLTHEHLPDDAGPSHERGWSGLFTRLALYLKATP